MQTHFSEFSGDWKDDIENRHDEGREHSVRDILDHHGLANWTAHFPTGKKLQMVHDGQDYHVVEDHPAWPEVHDAHQWLYDRHNDFHHYVNDGDANDAFWKQPWPLYHATTEENVRSIKDKGLSASNKTRGLTNTGIGAAVFAHEDPEYATYSYGDHIFKIDTPGMKADGYTPYLGYDGDIAETRAREEMAQHMGVENYHTTYETGMDPGTRVIHGDIPAKYVTYLNAPDNIKRWLR